MSHEEELFDAHIGISPGGYAFHLRKYHHIICSNCSDQHIDFKITEREYEKMSKLLNQLKPKEDDKNSD